ncbi:MAG: tRNA (N(6)-L-threonylcarbamoyladenosine(37)-C(2))-methylthiotransferase MtaB [Myxococcota bacterium]
MAAKRYFVQTFGCRVNQADSAGLAAELDGADMERTASWRDADVVVLNTCTVTHRSDADVRKSVNRLRRENPDARVVVTGCYAQRAPEELVQLQGVSAVVGNAHKRALPQVVGQVANRVADATPLTIHTPMGKRDPVELPPVEPVTTVLDRTRPFVKIQDGCDAHCTYCIIPEVRGRARSAPPDRVIDAVKKLVDDGWTEIVLAGVHLGTYVGGPERASLVDLVRRVLAVPGLLQLRLSCIEPMAFPLGLIDLAAEDPRLAPHFHLPLQAGDDDVLKRMVRPYRTSEYLELLTQIRDRIPHACLGTDVIVGFPGETDAQFENTCQFVADSPLNYVHVFSYSDRSGTPATRLDGKVDPRIIKLRSNALHAVSRQMWHRYLDAQVGRRLRALTLEPDRRHPDHVRALTPNFCAVRVEGQMPPNRLIEVMIDARVDEGLVGHAA